MGDFLRMQTLTKQTLQIYWQHSKKYKLAIFLIALGIVGITLTEIYVPFLYKKLFNLLAQRGPDSLSQLIKTVWLIALVLGTEWLFRRIQEFANIKFQARTMSDLLNTCFNYLQGHSYAFFTNNFVGSLVRRVNRYTRSFEDITDEIVYRIGRTALNVLGILIVLFYRHWLLGSGFLLWTMLFVGFNVWFAKYKIKYDLARAEIDTKTTAHLADTVTNNINIKLFGSQQNEFQTYQHLTDELYRTRQLTWNLNALADTFQSALLYLLEISLMFTAVKLWTRGLLTIGDFALIQAYIFQVIMRIWDVGRFLRRIYESLADANEMTEILTTPYGVQDIAGAKNLEVPNGKIEFQNVSFYYHKHSPILQKFNLTIKPGEKVALIGPSGGGKSTIVKLLFRFYDIQSGQILIDNQDISKVTQNSLRDNLALVPQEPVLFHRSLLENIRYAKPDASEAEIIQAAQLAHAHEFISAFQDGYQTYVGERGVKLSGGERQRVAIARAILKNAPILVLDEATSNLDSESERLIQDALKTLMKNKTTIVIAHRLSTIMQMDRIVVIDGGKITEQGRHEELLKIKKGTYQRLWEIQAGGFT